MTQDIPPYGSFEERIDTVQGMLERADRTTTTLFDASKSLGSLILTIGYLVEIIKDQESRIEQLEVQIEELAAGGYRNIR